MGSMARTPKAVQRDVRSTDKYAQILRAATKVFASRGFFSSKVADQLRKLQQLEDSDLNVLNRLLSELQLPVVFVTAKRPTTM